MNFVDAHTGRRDGDGLAVQLGDGTLLAAAGRPRRQGWPAGATSPSRWACVPST